MRQSRRLKALWASTARYRDSFSDSLPFYVNVGFDFIFRERSRDLVLLRHIVLWEDFPLPMRRALHWRHIRKCVATDYSVSRLCKFKHCCVLLCNLNLSTCCYVYSGRTDGHLAGSELTSWRENGILARRKGGGVSGGRGKASRKRKLY
jgi:hypothetical protein